jgi:dihydroorotase
MKYIIKQVTIIDHLSSHHEKQRDILIHNGIIEKVAEKITDQSAQEISIPGLHASPGWIDMQANFKDPGHEYKEDLTSGARAAARGGFTGVCIQSSTDPALDSKTQIEYIKRSSIDLPVHIYPIGAITHAREGKEMAELFDMSQAGAIAFSDDKRFIENPKLLELALNYSKNFNGLLIHFADTPALSAKGMMHEGDASVFLGMKGIPAMAEEQGLNRDLYLAEYTGGKLHYNLLSTSGSIALIKDAKKKKLQVTAGIAAHQVYFTDEALKGFESVHKVNPPYRGQKDVDALIAGLKDGTVDIICSDHSPEDIENKNLEFEYARNGIINIQTAFSAANTILRKKISLSDIINKFSTNPRSILGLPAATIEEGAVAELTFFDPESKFTFTKVENASNSHNSPFFDVELTGKVHGIFCKGKAVMN